MHQVSPLQLHRVLSVLLLGAAATLGIAKAAETASAFTCDDEALDPAPNTANAGHAEGHDAGGPDDAKRRQLLGPDRC
jgi:hypothetical protein